MNSHVRQSAVGRNSDHLLWACGTRVRVRPSTCIRAWVCLPLRERMDVDWNGRIGMALLSKGVLNPFLLDDRKELDSGRFDSIKEVVTITFFSQVCEICLRMVSTRL